MSDVSVPLYVELLRRELKRRQQANSRVSLRAFASKLGVHASSLSRILAGKQMISVQSAVDISEKLFTDDDVRKMFLESVANERAALSSRLLTENLSKDPTFTASGIDFRSVVDMIPLGVAVFAPDGLCLYANARFAIAEDNFTGVGHRASDFGCDEILKDALQRRKPVEGRVANQICLAKPQVNSSGAVDYIVISIEEPLSTRGLASATDLEISRQKRRSLAQFLPHAAWIADSSGKIEYGNVWLGEQVAPQFSLSEAFPFTKLVHTDDVIDVRERWQTSVEHNLIFTIECRMFTKGRGHANYLLRAAPIKNAKGRASHWLCELSEIKNEAVTPKLPHTKI